MEEYRSGHTGAVLKTVSPKGHGGSNPSSSASFNVVFVYRLVREIVDLLGSVRLRYAPPDFYLEWEVGLEAAIL